MLIAPFALHIASACLTESFLLLSLLPYAQDSPIDFISSP